MTTDLPIDYTPLSPSNLGVGMGFEPIEFSVKPTSHEKSRKLLEKSDLHQQTRINTPYLFPSEVWGMARVFSAYFGRLNEIAVSKATWEIYGAALPNQKLRATSKVVNIQTRNNLPFAVAETTTEDESGTLLLRSLDELLLLHNVQHPFYQEKAKETQPSRKLIYDRTRRVYFRYDWDNGNWLNNIHTDEYAQKFGYERGLPEFIMYLDWIFLSQLEQFGEDAYTCRRIELRKILPIYEGEIIKITETREAQSSTVQFFRGNQERVKSFVQVGDLTPSQP